MTRNVESGAADANLGTIVTPQEFLTITSKLTPEERRRIVDRALVLIEQF